MDGVTFLYSITAFVVVFSCTSEAAPRHRHVTTTDRNNHAKAWLVKYGYLHDSEDVTLFEQTMALMNMQKFHQLPVTGEVSDEDYNIMQMPRCGFPDMFGEDEVGGQMTASSKQARHRRYSINRDRYTWSTNSLNYRFVNYTSDLPNDVQEQEVDRAAQKWSESSRLSIYKTTSSASIEISFHRLVHGDDFGFDGPSGVLAHAFFPGSGMGGDIHFDDDESFITSGNGANFAYISLHEMGHSLGLEHSSNPDAVMSTTFDLSSGGEIELHNDDRAGIQSLYGAPDGGTTYTGDEVDPPTTVTCDKVYDAIADVGSVFFFFSGSILQQADSNFSPINQPLDLPRLFSGGPTSVDAAYVSDGTMLTLFKDNKYWRYDYQNFEIDPTTPSAISDFGVTTSSIDAVLYRSEVVYLFKDSFYWKYSTTAGTSEGPFTIQDTWGGVLSPLTSVFYRQSDGLVYFVSNTNYWGHTLAGGSAPTVSGDLNDIALEICVWCQAIPSPDGVAPRLPQLTVIVYGLILTAFLRAS